MKTLLVALALVAVTCAFDVDDIPPHMKDRLDRFIALKKQWEHKWLSMNEEEQKNYEQVLLSRLENLPQIEFQRMHDKVKSMPEEHRLKLRDYLRQRFPKEQSENYGNDVEEIDDIVQSLPEMIRNKIHNAIHVKFQEATAYSLNDESADDDLNFPDIPEIVDIQVQEDATGYSSGIPEELQIRIDEFLLKREDWKRKWENLPEEKRLALENYINARM